MTNTSVFEQYAMMKAEIKRLESLLEQLKPEIEELVASADNSTLVSEYGVFKMQYQPRWKYSDDLIAKELLLKEKMKLLKKKEELDNVAEKVSDGGRLVFSFKKQD